MLTLLSLLLGCTQEPADIAYNRYDEPIADQAPRELGARVVDADDISIHEHAVEVTSLAPEIVEVVSGGAFRCVASGPARLRLAGGGLEREVAVTCALD